MKTDKGFRSISTLYFKISRHYTQTILRLY